MTTTTIQPDWDFSTTIMDGTTPSSMTISDGDGGTTMAFGRHGDITILDGITAIIHLGMILSIMDGTDGTDIGHGGIPIIITIPIMEEGWHTIMTTRIGDMPIILLQAAA